MIQLGEPAARVNLSKVITHWPGMLRVVGSLVTGQVRVYGLLRMFGREGRPTPQGWWISGRGSHPTSAFCSAGVAEVVHGAHHAIAGPVAGRVGALIMRDSLDGLPQARGARYVKRGAVAAWARQRGRVRCVAARSSHSSGP